MYDLIIIGGGPAGMTAAVYAARKKLKFIIITKNFGGQAIQSSEVENYLGYQYITGAELVGKFQEHLDKFAIEQELSSVETLRQEGDTFIVGTHNGKEFKGKTVIIASGKAPRMLDVSGEKDFLGRGVTYCATCDAPLFSGMDVAVIGGGNSALSAAAQLSVIATKVYLVILGGIIADEVITEKVRRAKNVTFYEGYRSKLIKGETTVTSLIIEDTTEKNEIELSVQGIFVEIGSVPVSGFAADLVELNKTSEIKVDCRAETSKPGIFAAGDVTDGPEKQIIIAAGDGAKAALSAYEYLLKH